MSHRLAALLMTFALGFGSSACGGGGDDAAITAPADSTTQPSSTTPAAPTTEAAPITDAAPITEPAPTTDAVAATAPVTATFTSADGLPTDRVGQVVVGVDGTVWAAVEGDLVRSDSGLRYLTFAHFDGERWVDVGTPDLAALDGEDESNAPFVFGMDISGGPDGSLWVVNTGFDSTGDMYLYDGAEWSSPTNDLLLLTGAAALDGSLWTIGLPDLESADIGLYRVEGQTITRQSDPDGGIACVFCVDYDVDGDGLLWMYSGTISSFDGEAWTTLEGEYPELDGIGTQITEGRWALGADGTHWILRRAAEGAEIVRIVGGEVTTTPFAGTDVVPDTDCVATVVDLPTRPSGQLEQWRSEELEVHLAAFAGDAVGRLWLAIECVGVFSVDVDTGTVTEFGLDDGLPSLELLDIAAHPDGTIWVATTAGITRIVPEP